MEVILSRNRFYPLFESGHDESVGGGSHDSTTPQSSQLVDLTTPRASHFHTARSDPSISITCEKVSQDSCFCNGTLRCASKCTGRNLLVTLGGTCDPHVTRVIRHASV